MELREVGSESMDLTAQAQNRDRWRAVVNAVVNLRVPLNAGRPAEDLLASQAGHCCMEFVS